MKTQDWQIGKNYDLGCKKFSQKEIFDFAKEHDPLPFHLDLEVAKKSNFKGLVCSGGQAFYHFYPKVWVPLFGKTVIAGKGLKYWNFYAPIYVDQEVYATCSIKECIERKSDKEISLVWYFEFRDKNNTLLQDLNLIVIHKK